MPLTARTVRIGSSDHRGILATLTKEAPTVSGIYPDAKQLLIPPGDNDPRITPRVAILHVDAGDNASLHTYFRDRSGGIESHFHVPKSGPVEQYRNIYWQADANYKANDFAVSIETQGRAEGEWNAHQLAQIKRLLTWLNAEAGIPLVKCPRWDGAGVGYHIQFGAPGYWTNVAKACPGPDRIRQFNDVLVPWMSSNPSPREDWSDMATADEIRAIVREEIDAALSAAQSNDRSVRQNVRIGANARDLAAANGKALAALAESFDPTVRDAVRDALAEAVVDVKVTVTDNTEEN